MPWEGDIVCPKCGELMVKDDGTTAYEYELWQCKQKHAEAEARHPVQYPYIAIGQQDERQGLQRRVIKKEIIGAALYVFYEIPVD
jgi:DNA-directed RNA polymerase subunit M/transcription elongation factor TFIIS